MVSMASAEATDPIDSTSCDREPIHLLGHVQSFGCLLSVSDDWIITHASENTSDILGFTARDKIGTRFCALFDEPVSHMLRGKSQLLQSGVTTSRAFGVELFEDGRHFDISVHPSGEGFIYEFERKVEGAHRNDIDLVQNLMAQLRVQPDVKALTDQAATALRGLCGFDRVMVYQFEDDGSGHVLSEAIDTDMESFLGLHYPASDIPRQARALYTKNPLRLIADVDGPVFPILPAQGAGAAPIDLSFAVTRAVSPIHLQYLRNMGTAASMSISILKDGQLWGLLSCHHRTPIYVDYERRTAVELFGLLFSCELSDRLNAVARIQEREAKALHDRILTRVSRGLGLFEDFNAFAAEVWDVIDFDGIGVYSDGSYISLGAAPNEAEFRGLARFLNKTTGGEVFATENLSARYDRTSEIADRVAGILVLPISRDPKDYLVLFRKEIARSKTWAGKPSKIISPRSTATQLSPRTSFEAWQQEIRGHCSPWSEADITFAQALRLALLEIVLEVTDAAGREAAKNRQKQEILIAELNHRVRNILNLISGLVDQSSQSGSSLQEYTSDLNGRIQSMARAHDLLTRENWGPASLSELVTGSFEAYQASGAAPLWIDGEDFQLEPNAFSTMALVIHELTTNSAKYGALRNEVGTVHVALDANDEGMLQIVWRETGGPPVNPPTRQGFGTTIIENSVPFDLNGRSRIEYKLTGIEVTFEIPPECFRKAAKQPLTFARDAQKLKPSFSLPLGRVLLLEDNLVIAMDTGSKLKKLGATDTCLASTVQRARRLVADRDIDFAVLDVNLNNETSVDIAQELHAAGIPFVLATGYGADNKVLADFPDCKVLKKPYDLDTMSAVISSVLQDAGRVGSTAVPDSVSSGAG
jgi:light-regulated signal transduction histidine kinase (bacteriophytochrome)/ActR/RegA family two-component response regulator